MRGTRRLAGLAWVLWAAVLAAQNNPVEEAVEALQRGDLARAETILRAQPADPEALGVLAVVLDRQAKYDEADEVYRRALARSPRSAPLLNNYGNHLMTVGKLDAARDAFLKSIAINPGQSNARMQLARIAVERKTPAEALRYLEGQSQPDADVVRMQALFELKRNAEAEAILARLPQDEASIAAALASAGEYGKAEEYFLRALEKRPGDFDILYHLGLAAAHAGHQERARDILESALRRQPDNVDVLYDLAAVSARLGQSEAAVRLLANASRIAPARADVLQLLARTTAELGYFGDTIEAWDRYLKLAPADAVARRERAFAASAIGQDMAQAIAELKDFAARHPGDAVGHYELGVAEASASPEDALQQFRRALELKPELTAARIARGLLELKSANFAAALPDFEAASREEPDNPVVLDRLGQCYMALDRLKDAVPVLRRAAALAPRDSKTLMHLGRALTDSGQEEEARKVFARFRELGPDKSALPHPAGLIDFLNLSSAEQASRVRAGVERTVSNNPANAEAQVLYLKLLLDAGETEKAAATARHILELAPSGALLADAGNALFAAGQWDLARQLLEKSANPSAALNLALATSHAVSPRAGLAQLDQIPPAARHGDYYLARAQMLDAAGSPEEASAALNQALRANPTRTDLYRYAVTYLVERQRTGEAAALLDSAVRAAPDNGEILLLRAAVLEGSGRARDAERAWKEVQNRWPDWYNVWLARAVLAAWQGRAGEAKRLLETASALGAADAERRFTDATSTVPDERQRVARLLHALAP